MRTLRWGVLAVGLVASACGSNGGSAPDASSIGIDGGADAAASCVPAPAMLHGRWRGENNTNDALGLFNGVAEGGLTYGTGRYGMAFQGNGTDAYVSIDDGDALWPSGSFSVLAWVELTNNGNYQAIVSKNDCAGTCTAPAARVLVELEDSGVPYFEFATSAASAVNHTLYSTTQIDDGTWHMVVAVRDVTAQLQLFYIDDGAPASQAITGEALMPLTDSDAETDPALIGAWADSNATTFSDFNPGLIDEVAVIDRALSATEIAAIYHSPGGICP